MYWNGDTGFLKGFRKWLIVTWDVLKLKFHFLHFYLQYRLIVTWDVLKQSSWVNIGISNSD